MQLADLKGRAVGIWGFGSEGSAALDLVASRAEPSRIRVFTPEPLAPEQTPAGDCAEFVHGSDPVIALGDCDVVVRSPGVSAYRPDVAELKQRGVKLTTGTALFFAEVDGSVPVVAITGTKGKSTTAALTAHLARADGSTVELGGNIGKPLLSLLAGPPPGLYVVELSSFQLAELEMRLAVSVILNLYREHVDWHGSEDRYFEDKLGIVTHAPGTVPVLNALDRRLAAWGEGLPEVRWFGDARGTRVEAGEFVDSKGDVLASVSDLPLQGEHNALNACASLEALAALSLLRPQMGSAMGSFRPLRHRLEEVEGVADQRTWIDDSISTTPESAIAALRAFSDRHVTIILGGFDRDQHYSGLVQEVIRHMPSVVVIALPPTGERLMALLDQEAPDVRRFMAPTLAEAVSIAAEVTPQDGMVLLSPAAPSYGAYRNFEERGDDFVRLARATGEPRPS